jgi:hypothetical protein
MKHQKFTHSDECMLSCAYKDRLVGWELDSKMLKELKKAIEDAVLLGEGYIHIDKDGNVSRVKKRDMY